MRWRLALMLSAILLPSCGSSEPDLTPVKGRVFYRGQPLAGGMIVFAPDAERGNSGPLARSGIGLDGAFALQSEGQPGATPGWHRVAIAPPASTSSFFESLNQFRNPQLSGITREVKRRESMVVEIHLDQN